MDRRRAIAWAGSIAATGCAGVIALSALSGGFGLGTESVDDRQIAAHGPAADGADTGLSPGGSGLGLDPEAAGASPHSPTAASPPGPRNPRRSSPDPAAGAGDRGVARAGLSHPSTSATGAMGTTGTMTSAPDTGALPGDADPSHVLSPSTTLSFPPQVIVPLADIPDGPGEDAAEEPTSQSGPSTSGRPSDHGVEDDHDSDHDGAGDDRNGDPDDD